MTQTIHAIMGDEDGDLTPAGRPDKVWVRYFTDGGDQVIRGAANPNMLPVYGLPVLVERDHRDNLKVVEEDLQPVSGFALSGSGPIAPYHLPQHSSIALNTRHDLVECPYCTTTQKPNEVWQCRRCGGNLRARVL